MPKARSRIRPRARVQTTEARSLLEQEKVKFNTAGKINLHEYLWQPLRSERENFKTNYQEQKTITL